MSTSPLSTVHRPLTSTKSIVLSLKRFIPSLSSATPDSSINRCSITPTKTFQLAVCKANKRYIIYFRLYMALGLCRLFRPLPPRCRAPIPPLCLATRYTTSPPSPHHPAEPPPERTAGKEGRHESQSVSQTHMQQLPCRQARRRRPHHLQEHPPQTTSGLTRRSVPPPCRLDAIGGHRRTEGKAAKLLGNQTCQEFSV